VKKAAKKVGANGKTEDKAEKVEKVVLLSSLLPLHTFPLALPHVLSCSVPLPWLNAHITLSTVYLGPGC